MRRRILNYNKLWEVLKNRNLPRYYLVNNALGLTISTRTLAKLGKNKSVTTKTLLDICTLLDIDLNDIVETEVIIENE